MTAQNLENIRQKEVFGLKSRGPKSLDTVPLKPGHIADEEGKIAEAAGAPEAAGASEAEDSDAETSVDTLKKEIR